MTVFISYYRYLLLNERKLPSAPDMPLFLNIMDFRNIKSGYFVVPYRSFLTVLEKTEVIFFQNETNAVVACLLHLFLNLNIQHLLVFTASSPYVANNKTLSFNGSQNLYKEILLSD